MGRPGAGLAERADGPAGDLVGDALQEGTVLGPGLPVHHAARDLLHPERALAARRALAAAFVRIEGVNVRERLDHADRVVHNDHAARAAHRPDHGERIEVHRYVLQAPVVVDHLGPDLPLALVALAELEDLGRGAAGDHGLEGAAWKRAAAHLVQELTHRDLAHLELIVAGPAHVPRDTQDPRARVVGCADFRVGLTPPLRDVPDVAERLHVVDDRRALVEPEDRGKIGGLDARVGAFALYRLDKARLLAADVGARAAVDVDLAAVSRPEDVRADEVRGPGLGNRLLQDLRALGELPADVDVGALHLVREAGDHDPLEQLVGVLVDDVAVLEGPRLGFVGVYNQVDRLAALPVEQRPLDAARESRATAAPEARLLDVVHDLLGLPSYRFPQGLVAAVSHVAIQVVRVPGLVNVPEDQPELFWGGHACVL